MKHLKLFEEHIKERGDYTEEELELLAYQKELEEEWEEYEEKRKRRNKKI